MGSRRLRQPCSAGSRDPLPLHRDNECRRRLASTSTNRDDPNRSARRQDLRTRTAHDSQPFDLSGPWCVILAVAARFSVQSVVQGKWSTAGLLHLLGFREPELSTQLVPSSQREMVPTASSLPEYGSRPESLRASVVVVFRAFLRQFAWIRCESSQSYLLSAVVLAVVSKMMPKMMTKNAE